MAQTIWEGSRQPVSNLIPTLCFLKDTHGHSAPRYSKTLQEAGRHYGALGILALTLQLSLISWVMPGKGPGPRPLPHPHGRKSWHLLHRPSQVSVPQMVVSKLSKWLTASWGDGQ